jgi:hypothetical protein
MFVFVLILKWDLEFFRNFEKRDWGRKVLELPETWRSAKIFFCP